MTPRKSLILLALLSCITAGSAFAQIFPRIEKADVKQRVATGDKQPEDKETVDEQPEDTPVKIDGATVLRRYREILKGYVERDEKKAMTKHVEELHISVRDYLEGIFLLRLGYYKDAERKLKDVGLTVKRENEISTPELLNLAEEIKSGKAYYFRMMAVVMQHYDDFKDEKEALEEWADASKEAEKVRRELGKLVDTSKVKGSLDILPEMTGWLLTAKREWVNLHKAEKNIEEHPESVFSWQFFISTTGSKQNDIKKEYTPNYLKQRAAIQVLKEFWPKSMYMTGGWGDVTLASNHLFCGQLDNWEQYLEPQPYHGVGGRTVLKKGREGAEDFVKVVEALKNNE